MRTRPPRHWIKRPPRPSRATPPPLPPPNPLRRAAITVAAGVATAFLAALIAANTHADPAITWAALGFGGALGAAFAWRLQA